MTPIVEVTGLAHGGAGICRIDGQVCFVTGALPGDRIRVHVTRRAKQVLWGVIEGIEEPSPDRVEPCCPQFATCGGCGWLHFAYPAQAEWKQRIVRDCLARIAGVEIDPAWAEDAERRLGYRTRVRVHGATGRLGFYAEGSHDIIDIERCPLCHETLNAALGRLRAARVTGTVEVVTNPLGDDVLVWTQRPHRRLRNAFPDAGWPRQRPPRAAFSFDEIPVLNGTFCQASLLLNRVLRKTVDATIGTPDTLLDLYCGAGNLSLARAAHGRVAGLDGDRAAVGAAAGLGIGKYRHGNEAAFQKAIGGQPWDVILLDPPRTGAKAIMGALADSAAGAIVYVSCDAATLARDVKVLVSAGWRMDRAVVVDMFPHTAHAETVCRLVR